MTELLVKNGKIAKSNDDNNLVYNFGIPAFQSITGVRTCPMAGTCAKGCYAQAGTYNWPVVKNAYEWRLAQSMRDDFAEIMGNAIATKLKTAQRTGKQLIIRVNDSGDMYNLEYVSKWFSIMNAYPEVKFYAYTKAVKLFKNIGWQIPANFTLIYSYGGLQDNWIDPNIDRHAAVFETAEEAEEAGYTIANDNDLIAIGPNKKIGLVFHGAKSKTWTANPA